MSTFKVQVQGDEPFVSDVYAINGNDFLLYCPRTGFGWYHFDTMIGGEPMITLVRGENDDEA